MFDKKQLIERVNLFKKEFGTENVVLLHGGSLVLHGIKDTTRDIDVYVDNLHSVVGEKLEMREDTFYQDGEAFVGVRYEYGDFDFGLGKCMSVDCIEIDGVLVQSLQQILEEKRLWGRPKDIEAIKLIEGHYYV